MHRSRLRVKYNVPNTGTIPYRGAASHVKRSGLTRRALRRDGNTLEGGSEISEWTKAFAVTTDRERQMAVWEQVSAQGYRPSAWQVKRLLTEERVPGASAIARFVGVEAKEACASSVNGRHDSGARKRLPIPRRHHT